MDKAFAQHFAEDWIAAWNAHDLERILSHYAEGFEMSSPVIVKMIGEASGRLTGKVAIAEYWQQALERAPDLHFTLRSVLTGADSVTIVYDGVRGPSAEVFFFNAEREVVRAAAHYEVAAV